MSTYKKNSIIKGQVTGIEKYGIFVNVDAFYNGLIHISEISDGFVRNVNDFVNIGDTICCKIIEVDEDNCQLKLSIKGIKYKLNAKVGEVIESPRGFSPLKRMLPKWIEETLKKMDN